MVLVRPLWAFIAFPTASDAQVAMLGNPWTFLKACLLKKAPIWGSCGFVSWDRILFTGIRRGVTYQLIANCREQIHRRQMNQMKGGARRRKGWKFKFLLRRSLKLHYIPEAESQPCLRPGLSRMSSAHFPMHVLSLEVPQVGLCYLQFNKPDETEWF